jgi:hypothetical protein
MATAMQTATHCEHGHQRAISSHSAATTVVIDEDTGGTSPLRCCSANPDESPDIRVSVQQPGGSAAPPPSSLARAITWIKSPGTLAAFGVSHSQRHLVRFEPSNDCRLQAS